MSYWRTIAAFVIAAISASAQDTRIVKEPVIPPSCAVLEAKLPAKLLEADESRPDTARIQEALDSCAAGHSVELKPSGEMRAFLAGPLQLRAGVTLLVDDRSILFASRNPRTTMFRGVAAAW